MNPLLAIYPRAVLSDTCCTAEDVFCFYDEKRRVYVAIPKEDITPKEKLLLESLLTPAEEKGDFFPETAAAKRWRRFLLEEGRCLMSKSRVSVLSIMTYWENGTGGIYGSAAPFLAGFIYSCPDGKGSGRDCGGRKAGSARFG